MSNAVPLTIDDQVWLYRTLGVWVQPSPQALARCQRARPAWRRYDERVRACALRAWRRRQEQRRNGRPPDHKPGGLP